MARISLLPEDLAEPADLVAAIRTRRRGKLNEADRTVLHAPQFARGWNAIAQSVRHDLSLDPRLLELAICMVGVVNGARFEVLKHAPEFLRHGGSQAQLDALPLWAEAPESVVPGLFGRTECAVLALAVEMTRTVRVSDACFAELREVMGTEQRIVEMVGAIAMYNMVSRFLVALEVDEAPKA